MAQTLEMFLERKFKQVEEDGAHVSQIILQCGDGGQVWDRWDRPFRSEEGGPGAYALAQLITEVIDGASEEWPASRSHQVMVTALDKNGADLGRFVKSVKGKSKTASPTMLASESVQHANAMQMQVETMKVLLGAANNQIVQQQATIDGLLRNVGTLTALVCETKVEQALAKEVQDNETQKEMWAVAKQVAPELVQLIGNHIAKKG